MANPFVRSGWVSVLGGMNGAIAPSLLHDTQYALGENVTSRGGLLHTRPRWERVSAYIPYGQFQGACVYRARSADFLAVVVSGVLYMINLATFARIRCAAFPTTSFSKAYFCQVDRYLVVQNGIYRPVENWPIIMDGQLVLDNGTIQVPVDNAGTVVWTRLSDVPNYAARRVPIGTLMAYGHGRLFVVVPRIWDEGLLSGTAQWISVAPNRYFIATDVIKPDNSDEVLSTYQEGQYLSQGGALSLPLESGEIKAFSFFRNAHTGTGVGELIVFGEYGVSAFAVGSPRAQWVDMDLSQVLFTETGAVSERAVVPVNDDLAFRAVDGIRFVRYSLSQVSAASGALSNLPQSMEIEPILAQDTLAELQWSSISLVNNRLFTSTYGDTDSDANNPHFFWALAPLDLYVVGATGPSGNLSARSTPAYDGIWTGLDVLQTIRLPFSGVDMACAICRVSTDRLELWRLTDSTYYDGVSDRPLCRVTSRSLNFESPTVPKDFRYAEVWVSKLRGAVTFKLYWRPDDYALWTDTNSITVNGCETGEEQQRWALRLAIPADKRCYDPATNRDTRRGFAFQFCLEWRGYAQIEKVVFYASPQPESLPNIGCSAEACQVLTAADSTGIKLDPLEYRVSVLDPLPDPGETSAYARPTGVQLYLSRPYIGSDGQWHVDGIVVAGDPGQWCPNILSDYGPVLLWDDLSNELQELDEYSEYEPDGSNLPAPIPIAPGEVLTWDIPLGPPYIPGIDTPVTAPLIPIYQYDYPTGGSAWEGPTSHEVVKEPTNPLPGPVPADAVGKLMLTCPATVNCGDDFTVTISALKYSPTWGWFGYGDVAPTWASLAFSLEGAVSGTPVSPNSLAPVTWTKRGVDGVWEATMQMNASCLESGAHQLVVMATDGTSAKAPITISAGVAMQVDWADLPEWTFSNDADLTGTIDITNTGDASLDWEITFIGDADDWMSASATSGTLGAGESATVTITCAKPTPAGVYTGSINVTAPGVETKTETVTITAQAYTTTANKAQLYRDLWPGQTQNPAYQVYSNTLFSWSVGGQYFAGSVGPAGSMFEYYLYPPNTSGNADDRWKMRINDGVVNDISWPSVTLVESGGVFYPSGSTGNLTFSDGNKGCAIFGPSAY